MAFNRTIVELKPLQACGLIRQVITFNRTIVELKPRRTRKRQAFPIRLLIEPLWN